MKYRIIIRMNLDSMEFFVDIICLKKGWDICNKPLWICRYWYSLGCFLCKKILRLLILAVLALNMFLKKLKNLLVIKTIVTRNNIVRKLGRSYCLCFYKTILLEPDSTERTKQFLNKECNTLFVPLKIK